MNQHCTTPDPASSDKPEDERILREIEQADLDAEPQNALVAMAPAFILSAMIWVAIAAMGVLVWKLIL